ncbi:MAG: hypothetical protein JWO03_1127 [Bacteroidetes bacterium]|nr:hypothetical protein [Bacteroidota bacterium]
MKSLSVITILTVLLLSACHKGSDGSTNNPNDKTHIQFVSASPSEQNPDLYLLGSSAPQIAGFYYYLSTGYDQPRIDDLTVTIKDGTHGTVLTSPPLGCSKDSFYTWFLYDTFPNLKYFMTTDVMWPSVPAGKAAVKFVNLSPNAGPIMYRVQGQSALTPALGYASTSPLTAASSFIQIDTGWHTIEVVDANTNQVIDSLHAGQLKTDQGSYYTLWTTGYRGATGQNEIYTGWTQDH